MKKILLLMGLISLTILNAVSLEDLRNELNKNHPIAQKEKILLEINKIENSKILKEIFPQFSLNAKATWQSETMVLPINSPMLQIPEMDKDREEISLNVNQIIYDAGINSTKRKISSQKNRIEIQSSKVDLQKLDEVLMKLYFGVLIQKEKIKIEKANHKSLETKEISAENAVKYGILTSNEVWLLQKEILNVQQKIAEDTSKLEYLIREISILTGSKITVKDEFMLPLVSKEKELRPEFNLFKYKRNAYFLSLKMNSRAKYPKLFAFAQISYGKPGLNSFSNDWNDYQIYGVNFKWDIWNWKKYSSEQSILKKKIIETNLDETAFKINLKMQEEESKKKIELLENQIQLSKKITKLDKKILDSATEKFANGDETATNLLIYSNSYFSSKIKTQINQIQLNYEKYNLNKNIGEIK